MSDRNLDSGRDRVVAALREFVEALDRRVARVERLGEVSIAREAAALRLQALARIDELAAVPEDGDEHGAAGGDAVMADDGGPLHGA